jgi:O-antigen/teichoic acid export membrane protein
VSTKHIASSTLWQIASQATMAALSIVTTKFVALSLSKDLAGIYNSAYGYLQIFGILADFGLYAVAIREVSAAPDERNHGHNSKADILGALLTLRLLIMAASLGTGILLAWVLPSWRGTELPLSISIAAFVPFFTLLAGTLRTTFQVRYKMHYVFLAEVTQRIVTAGGIAAFFIAGTRLSTDPRVMHAFLGIGGLGAFILLLLSFFPSNKLLRVQLNTDGALVRHLFMMAAPYGFAFFCTTLYRQCDISLIALLRPDFQLQNAYYGFVQRSMDMAYIFPTFLLNSTLPLLIARKMKGEDTRSLAGKALIATLLLSIVSCLFAALWSRPLMSLLTSEAYLAHDGQPGSDTALRILSLSMLSKGLVVYAFYGLLAAHKWRGLVTTLLLSAGVSLCLNIFLIPRYGFVGASVTSAGIHAGLVLALLPQCLRALPITLPMPHVLRTLFFTALLVGGLLALRPLLTSDGLPFSRKTNWQ